MSQLLLFEEPKEQKLERKVHELEECQDRVRKKLFQENSFLKKEVKELKSKLEFLEAYICKGKLFV